jgi:hypothetical protein
MKQQIMEVAFILGLLVMVALSLVVAVTIYQAIGNQLHSPEMAQVATNNGADNSSLIAYDKFSTAWPIFDYMFPFIVIGLMIGLIITSFQIPAHPIYLVINIIGFLALVFIGAIYSNTWSAVNQAAPQFANATLTYFPITNFVMSYLPYLAAALVLVSSIVMYAKGYQ